MEDQNQRRRFVTALVCCLFVALPFGLVHYPPLTDLPQHIAQVRLFLETMNGVNADYRVQWFTPYSLFYVLPGAAWVFFPADEVGRVATLALALLCTLAVHLLAARRQRPLAAAVLASVLFFNHAVYWGFLSFVAGWLSFMAWFLVTTRRRESLSIVDGLLFCCGALVLYAGHALWFVVGIVWLLVHDLVHRLPLRQLAFRLLSVSPVIVGAALWYPHLAANGFVSPTVWFVTPPERIAPSWLVDAVLGGLQGAAEYLVLAVLLIWLFVSVWQNRDDLRAKVNVDLLLLAALFLLMGLLLPDQHMNTIQFAARWLPAAMITALLAVPAPTALPRLHVPLAVALLGTFCLSTALAWQRFERDELSGLEESLAALPSSSRVIGLDFVKESPVVKGRPFLQTFAYAQVLHGGALSFSFASFAPSPVVYRQRKAQPWTPNLVWFAERVQRADLGHFDYALLNGPDRVHAAFAAEASLAPRTSNGRWRLYEVVHPRTVTASRTLGGLTP
jgi:hypothetical protein